MALVGFVPTVDRFGRPVRRPARYRWRVSAVRRWRQPQSVSWRVLHASLSSDLNQSSSILYTCIEYKHWIQAVQRSLCQPFLTALFPHVHLLITRPSIIVDGFLLGWTRLRWLSNGQRRSTRVRPFYWPQLAAKHCGSFLQQVLHRHASYIVLFFIIFIKKYRVDLTEESCPMLVVTNRLFSRVTARRYGWWSFCLFIFIILEIYMW